MARDLKLDHRDEGKGSPPFEAQGKRPGDLPQRWTSLENRRLAERVRCLEAELEALRRALRRATNDALTDPLTGLANRRAFDEALGDMAAAGGNRTSPAQLLLADIDTFKQLNDAHGHHFGDAVLRLTGELLTASVRSDSMVARIGGDEFALLLPGTRMPGRHGAGRVELATRAIAERVCSRIAARPLAVRGHPGCAERITLSIGIALWQAGEDSGDWFARADRALYAAKCAGRNRVVLAD